MIRIFGIWISILVVSRPQRVRLRKRIKLQVHLTRILVLLVLYHRVLDIVKKTSKRTSQEAAKVLDYDRVEAKPLPNETYE
jgi:hypothetical protein